MRFRLSLVSLLAEGNYEEDAFITTLQATGYRPAARPGRRDRSFIGGERGATCADGVDEEKAFVMRHPLLLGVVTVAGGPAYLARIRWTTPNDLAGRVN